MTKIAACLITKNEERYIERILHNIHPHVDGVFIYDTGSTDRTVELARGHGAEVCEGEWRYDFAWARNQSYDLPGRDFDWIVYFDADDTVDGLDKLRHLASDAISSVDSFAFPYHNDWSGIMVNYDTIRMVRRDSGYRWRHPVHEQLETDVREHRVTLDYPIWRQKHTWQDRIKKTQRNLDTLLEYEKMHGLDDWLASAIVLTMVERGQSREAYQWLRDNKYEMRISKCG